MKKKLDNIQRYDKLYREQHQFYTRESEVAEGPIITFQVTAQNKVVCRFYNTDFQHIIMEMAKDHKRHVRFYDIDFYYPDRIQSVIDYLNKEKVLDFDDLDELDWQSERFATIKKKIERLLKAAGAEMSEDVKEELKIAEQLANVSENEKDICDIATLKKDGTLDQKSVKSFDTYGDLMKHMLSLEGKTFGALIHDEETKKFLSGKDGGILPAALAPKIKSQIIEQVVAIVRKEKTHYPTAHAYLLSQENEKT